MRSGRKNFGKLLCKICGRTISLNGLAQHSHQKKHEREAKKRRDATIHKLPPDILGALCGAEPTPLYADGNWANVTCRRCLELRVPR